MIGKRFTTAHIVAFIAGPCSMAQGDVSELISRLGNVRLDFVLLASRAELGTPCMQLLHRVINLLNTNWRAQLSTHGGRAFSNSAPANGNSFSSIMGMRCDRLSRLHSIDPPQHCLEQWQQLEPLIDRLHSVQLEPELAVSSEAVESDDAGSSSTARSREQADSLANCVHVQEDHAPQFEDRSAFNSALGGALQSLSPTLQLRAVGSQVQQWQVLLYHSGSAWSHNHKRSPVSYMAPLLRLNICLLKQAH